MIATEQNAPDALPQPLPLAVAAARLGIRPDALRMRINRGKIKGFKRGGRLFAVLEAVPDQAQRTANIETEQPPFDPSEQGDDVRDRGAAPESGESSMPLVIEFQKVELSRLLRDNTRLNHRLDQMMEELRHLREMQQREQVLRQQDQTLRQRAQTLIERLTATPPAGPAPSSVRASVRTSVRAPVLPATPPAAPPGAPPAAPGGPAAEPQLAPATSGTGPINPAARPEGGTPMEVPEPTAAEAGSTDEPADSSPKEAAYAYEVDTPLPGPQTGPPPGPRNESGVSPAGESPAGESPEGESPEGARGDSAELADMLKDIGASLRAMDKSAVDARTGSPPASPPTSPPASPPAPPSAPGTRRAPGVVARPPEDDQAGLLEILGRMGPSSEERRTAARLMKRLLKGRTARRRGEPGGDADC